MQERIDGPYDPTKLASQKQQSAEEAKTNPVLFEQIKSYATATAKAEILLQALGFLELLNQDELQKRGVVSKEALKKEFETKALPADQMARRAAEKVKNVRAVIPQLQELQKALTTDPARALALLQEIYSQMSTPAKAPLPEKAQKELQENLKTLTQAKGPQTNQPLNTLLFQSQLGQIVVAAQANWGENQPMVLQSMMDKLKQLANATPPGPFADLAKNMLADLQSDDGAEILKGLLQNPQARMANAEKEAQALLKAKGEDPDLQKTTQNAVNALMTAASPKGLYDTYLQEIRSQMASQSLKEGIEKISKAQKQYFLNALQTLKEGAKGNPAIAKLLAKLVALKFPPETQEEIQQVSGFTEEFYATYSSLVQSKTLSRQSQREFIEKTKDFCEQAIKATDEEGDKQMGKVAALRGQLETVQSLPPTLAQIQEVLSTLEQGGKLKGGELQQLTEAIVSLQSHYGSLSTREQTEIDTMMQELAKLSPDAKGLAKTVASNHLHTLLSDYAGQHKNPRVETLTPWLRGEIAALKQKEGSPTFWPEVLNALTGDVNAAGFPASNSSTTIPYATVKEGIFAVNTQFAEQSAQKSPLTAVSPAKALYHTAVVADTVDDKSAEIQKQIEGTTAAHKTLESHANTFYSARAEAENKKLMTPQSEGEDIPLPLQFAEVIFGKVIPNQNQMLMAAGELLQMFNSFSSGCNTLLSDITGWDSANYNLNGYFSAHQNPSQTPPTFNTSPTTAYSQVQAAMSQAANNYSQLYKTAQDIQSQINAISPPANSSQAARLTQLQGYLNNLIDGDSVSSLPAPPLSTSTAPAGSPCAMNNIIAANNAYSGIANAIQSQMGKNPPATSYTLDQSLLTPLQPAENAVMNGATGTTGQGLKDIYTAIQADQTAYSGLSQQQQMQLQLTMTETQQMFSTITSAMQDLNQSYSSIAQAISK